MSFIWPFEDINRFMSLRPTFYNAEMLSVLWLTKEEIVQKLLPPPLEPMQDPLVFAFVANYPKTNFGLPYYESALFLGALFNGEPGFYCLAMPVTNDLAMAGGRELGGYPKKIAQIQLNKDGQNVLGWAERHGIRFIEIQAILTGAMTEKAQVFADLITEAGGMIVFNFLHGQKPIETTLQPSFHLIRQFISVNFQTLEVGEAKVTLTESQHDPWAEVEVVKVLGATYSVGNSTMEEVTVLAETDPMTFAPYAFRMWDPLPD
ncbi:MAG: acetoacetate decarboxylase family protein [Candidatus Heimdallarchaeota archaeon]|nr:MAG: acetoacetate decarboxylase family protein [Candidatus Heimdallarchaeota archaeon]